MVDARDTLERLMNERGDSSVALSRLLGRNAAYVQQFIHGRADGPIESVR